MKQESSTVAASASVDYVNSSSASASDEAAHSSPASTAPASTTSHLGTSAHSNSSGWFWHSSHQIRSPSSVPDGCPSEALSSGLPECRTCRPTVGRGLDGVEVCENCLSRDRGSGRGFVRSSDLDDVGDLVCCSPSPAAELLGLSDLFCRKFTVDSRCRGRMVLVDRHSTVDMDSESDDMTSTREARSEQQATASTLSLNDLLDDDTGSSDPSTPEGCDNLSISDYEQLVIEGGPTALADNSSLLPPPPLSLLHNGYSPSTTQPKYVFIPVSEAGWHADSSTDSSDYTNLADDETAASDLPNPVTSCTVSSGLNAVSGQPLNGTDQNCVPTSQQSDVLAEESPTSCHMLVNGLNGVHRPTVLLTRRRKRASLAASAIVHSIQQNGRSQFANVGRQPVSKSGGCGPRTVVLYRDCLDGSRTASSDDCASLESLAPPRSRSSDGADAVVCEKPFSSQDDGYCTAKSNVAVQLACCHQLSKITSSSEVDSSVGGISLRNSFEADDFRTVSAAPERCTGSPNEKFDVFGSSVAGCLHSENSRHQWDMSGIQLFGELDSSDLETDAGDVGTKCYSGQSSSRSYPTRSSSSVVTETCRLPSESAENCSNFLVGYHRQTARQELDGDVRQAIDMFAFLDDHEPSADAASNTSR